MRLQRIQGHIQAAIWRSLASIGVWFQSQRDIFELRILARSLVADGRDLEGLANELERALAAGSREKFSAGEGW